MTSEQAEARIVELVQRVDNIRATEMHIADKAAAIQEVEREIADFKQITGPRPITGTAKIVLPVPSEWLK